MENNQFLVHLKYIEIKRHLHRFDLVSLTEVQLSIQPQVGSLLVEERDSSVTAFGLMIFDLIGNWLPANTILKMIKI